MKDYLTDFDLVEIASCFKCVKSLLLTCRNVMDDTNSRNQNRFYCCLFGTKNRPFTKAVAEYRFGDSNTYCTCPLIIYLLGLISRDS